MGGVVFDHSALLALGAGNKGVSGILADAEQEGVRIFVPMLCLTAAVAARPVGMADHVAGLDTLELIDLDYSAAAGVGSLIAAGVDWQYAHAVQLATPIPGILSSRLMVITNAPAVYTAHKIPVRPLRPNP